MWYRGRVSWSVSGCLCLCIGVSLGLYILSRACHLSPPSEHPQKKCLTAPILSHAHAITFTSLVTKYFATAVNKSDGGVGGDGEGGDGGGGGVVITMAAVAASGRAQC